ncbi:MAG: alternative ribosome rescue aminoacyl-tRNA hydrolase ArfB [Nocardioidaceae bacterium]
MADGIRVNPSVFIPDDELSWRFSRSSGPGGQGVNTTDSRVELSWDLERSPALSPAQRARAVQRLANRLHDGILTIAASEHRSQQRNRDAARRRLAALLAAAVRPVRVRRPTGPTRASVRRRTEAKKRRGEIKRLRRPPSD